MTKERIMLMHKYANGICHPIPKNSVLLTCYNKNIIHIGTQAVSRYHQLKKLYPSYDLPI